MDGLLFRQGSVSRVSLERSPSVGSSYSVRSASGGSSSKRRPSLNKQPSMNKNLVTKRQDMSHEREERPNLESPRRRNSEEGLRGRSSVRSSSARSLSPRRKSTSAMSMQGLLSRRRQSSSSHRPSVRKSQSALEMLRRGSSSRLSTLRQAGTSFSHKVFERMPSGLQDAFRNRITGIRDQELELLQLFQTLFPYEDAPISEFWRPSEVKEGNFVHCEPADVDRVIRGQKLSFEEFSALEKQIFRVFISSGGSDTEWERGIFHAFCVPYLRHFARMHGMELEVCDNRWGVSETNVHLTSDMKEARNADFMVVVLGDHKLGHRTLPSEIERKIYFAIHDYIDQDKTKELDAWFRLDENKIPAVYVLQPPEDREKERKSKLLEARLDAQKEAQADKEGEKRAEEEWRRLNTAEFEDVSWDRYDDVEESNESILVAEDAENVAESKEQEKWKYFKESSLGPSSAVAFGKNMAEGIFHAICEVICAGWNDTHLDQEPKTLVLGPNHVQVLIHEWEQQHGPIQEILRHGAHVVAKRRKNGAIELPFNQSISEMEISHGPDLDSGKVLTIIRHFKMPSPNQNNNEAQDIPKNPLYVEQPRSKYNTIKDAKQRLMKLHEELKSKCGKILEYSVDWENRIDPKYSLTHIDDIFNQRNKHQHRHYPLGLDPLENKDHTTYLSTLAKAWTHALEDAIMTRPQMEKDPLLREILHHGSIIQERAKYFYGKNASLERVKAVVDRSSTVALYGKTGKSSYIAKVAMDCAKENPQGVIVTRFVGATYTTDDIVTMVRSLYEQIFRAYQPPNKEPEKLPANYTKVVSAFWEALGFATKGKPLFLLLAGLDHIKDPCKHCWIPSADKMPCFVTIVVAVTKVDSIRVKHYAKSLELDELDPLETRQILEEWLESDQRSLQKHQMRAIVQCIQRADNPTYLLLRTCYKEALRWKSFNSVPTAWTHVHDLSTAMNAVFDRLEEEHGKLFTSRAMTLLSMARDGLTCSELEDLLSLDNDVISECFERYLPMIARVPHVYVARLLDSLGSFVVAGERNRWVHFQYRKCAQIRYCQGVGNDNGVRAATVLSEYFGDFVECPNITLQTQKALVCTTRQVLPQPLKFETNASWNIRHLRERPRALYNAEMYEECLYCLVDPEFVRGMVANEWTEELAELLKLENLPHPEFRAYFTRALVMSKPIVEMNPNLLEEQLWGRLEPAFGVDHDIVKIWNSRRKAQPGLHAHWSNILEPVNSPLISTLYSHTKRVKALCPMILADGRQVVASGAIDQAMNVTDLETGKLLYHCTGHVGGITSITSAMIQQTTGKRRVFIVASTDVVKVWDAETGVFITSCKGHVGKVETILVKENDEDGSQVLCSGSQDETVRTWNILTGENLGCISGHTGGVSHMASIRKANLVVVACVNSMMRVLDIENKQCMFECRGHTKPITELCANFHPSNDQLLFATCSTDSMVKVWSAKTGACMSTCEKHSEGVTVMCTAKTDKQGKHLIITSGLEGTFINVWDYESGETKQLKGLTGIATAMCAVGSNVFVGCNNATIHAWDLETGKKLFHLDSHSKHINIICRLLGSKDFAVVTGSDDATMKIWDASSNQFHKKLQTWVCTTFFQDLGNGNSLVYSGGIDNSIVMRDGNTGEPLGTLGHHTDSVQALCVAKCQGVPQRRSGNQQQEEEEQEQDNKSKRTKNPSKHPNENYHWVFSGSEDGTVKIWKVRHDTPQERSLHATYKAHGQSKVWALAYMVSSSDNKEYIVTGSEDGVLRVVDINSAREIQALKGHSATIRSLCPLDHRLVASGADDGMIIIWDILDGTKVHSLSAHHSRICGLSKIVLHDGNMSNLVLASASLDETVKTWNVYTGDLINAYEGDATHGLAFFSLHNKNWLVMAGSATQKLHFHTISKHGKLKFEEKVPYPRSKITTMSFAEHGTFSFGCQDGSVSVLDFCPND